MSRYVVVTRIVHGTAHEEANPGDEVDLSAEDAASLLAHGAIKALAPMSAAPSLDVPEETHAFFIDDPAMLATEHFASEDLATSLHDEHLSSVAASIASETPHEP